MLQASRQNFSLQQHCVGLPVKPDTHEPHIQCVVPEHRRRCTSAAGQARYLGGQRVTFLESRLHYNEKMQPPGIV